MTNNLKVFLSTTDIENHLIFVENNTANERQQLDVFNEKVDENHLIT